MKDRDNPTRHEMRTRVPPILTPFPISLLPNDRVIIHSSQIEPVRSSLTRTSSLVRSNQRWRGVARTQRYAISSLSSLHSPSSSCKLLDICNPRFIAHSYHSKRVFSTSNRSYFRATVCFSQPCDRLMYFGARAADRRPSGEREYLLGTESVPGLSRCSHLSRKPFRRIPTSVSILPRN